MTSMSHFTFILYRPTQLSQKLSNLFHAWNNKNKIDLLYPNGQQHFRIKKEVQTRIDKHIHKVKIIGQI